jgi:hypothetical protein
LHGSALSPLIGRDEEINLLLRRWARVKAGDGEVVLVSGEAGLGKSRITAALAERLHAEPHIRLRYFCSPYYQDSALFPFDRMHDARAVEQHRIGVGAADIDADASHGQRRLPALSFRGGPAGRTRNS